jgi:predicted GTPase
MLKAHIPVVSVCAVRTGAGKSQMTRAICVMLRELGLRVAAIRHPIPYGDLVRQRAQRFATLADMDEAQCTIEEREEYEPLIESGSVVFAGVDYADILKTAEAEADVIVWEGGNNDLPFIVSNYHIVIADALRPGHEMLYHPGEANARMADVIIINKVDSAAEGAVETIRENLAMLNSRALILEAFSPVLLDDAASAKGKRALVIEDGPTVTHGGMPFGAGTIAARNAGSVPVDPRPFAVGSIRRAFEQYPHLGKVLPALGYRNEQVAELQETVNQADCDIVISGTPIDITRVIKVGKPVLRARYELQQVSGPKLKDLLDENIVPLACSCEGEACRIK